MRYPKSFPQIVLVTFCLISLVWPALASERKNVLLICVDDLRPELKSFGVDYIHSPNIDRLAERGRAFQRHYVNAPTCGASRFSLLTGLYGPRSNQALFDRADAMEAGSPEVPPSMPEWFRQNGYVTVSVGKVSHHPGGWGGGDWDDVEKLEMPEAWDRQLMPSGGWKHPRGAMHGLAHGEQRIKAGDMDLFQSEPGSDMIYPDGLIMAEGVRQLEVLANAEEPFFLAVGLLKPHLPFGAPAMYLNYYDELTLPEIPWPQRPSGPSTWHGSGEFMKYNRWGRDPREDVEFADDVRRHYAACVSYADKLVGDLMASLEASGVADETIVVLWGDHGWHLGEHAVWGKHTLFEESLRSPLIIVDPEMKRRGESSDAVVETVDVFPTLCHLADLEIPDFVSGKSLQKMMRQPRASGHVAYAYHGQARTLRTDRYRLILHDSGEVEFYDHRSVEKETRNLADQKPRLARRLSDQLAAKRELQVERFGGEQ